MKMVTLHVAALSLLAVAVADARGWSLEDCSETGPAADKRAEYAAEVKAAAPDTPLYVPHPFPRTDAEVFANFVAFHTNAFADTPLEAMASQDQRLFAALQEQRIRYEVVDVENWSPLRCAVPKSRQRWLVLRLFDATDGTELARASIDDMGHVGRLRHRSPDRDLAPIAELRSAENTIRGFDAEARNAQYVAPWGTIGCDELSPCIAMRGTDSVYLLSSRSGELFRFDFEAPRLSFREDMAVDRRSATLTDAEQRGLRLVSLGGDSLVEAEPVRNGDSER